MIHISENKLKKILNTFISFLVAKSDDRDEIVENIVLLVKLHGVNEEADAIGQVRG